MTCPKCESKTKIIDSRQAGGRTVVNTQFEHSGIAVRRRHECPKCNTRFSTIEVFCEILPPAPPKGPRGKKNKKRNKPKTSNWLEKVKQKLEK